MTSPSTLQRSLRNVMVAGLLASGFSPASLHAQVASPPDTTPEAPSTQGPGQSPPVPAASKTPDAPPPSTQSPGAAPGSTSAAAEQKKKADTPSKKEKQEEHEPIDPDTGSSTLSGETLGLLPNPFEPKGIKFTLTYVADGLASLDGGLRRGAIYEGRLNAAIDLDLAKLAGAAGLLFHANAFQSHGPRLSAQYIGNEMPVSSIEELATTRLSTKRGSSKNSGMTNFPFALANWQRMPSSSRRNTRTRLWLRHMGGRRLRR